MHTFKPSSEYEKVAQANLQYYAQSAQQYDETETCVTSSRFQEMLGGDLKDILTLFSEENIHILDACGGSGNVSIKLLEAGYDVLLCDQSRELLNIFEAKCEAKRLKGKVIVEEIGTFLNDTQAQFDLIIFSSALHHLQDYKLILSLVSKRLKPGGYLYTVFDPVKWRFPTWEIIYCDYIWFKLMRQRHDFFPAVKRKLKRMFNKDISTKADTPLTEDTVGVLAEFHVRAGIDDFELIKELKDQGFRVIWHKRYADARYKLFLGLLKMFGCTTNFRMLLQRS